MATRKNDEGAQFVRYFGPVLDALRRLGGSRSSMRPSREAKTTGARSITEQVAEAMGAPSKEYRTDTTADLSIGLAARTSKA